MSKADGYVLPNPGIPKTLGILNVIFAVLLMLLSLCAVGGMLAAPALTKFSEKTIKDAQSKAEAQQKADLKTIDDQIASAPNDEAKEALEKQRADVVESQPQFGTIDMADATAVLKNPTIMTYTYTGLLTGLFLLIMLLISGIGLIRLTPWGRSLALWWGGLQIVQVAVLLAVNIFVVMPLSRPYTLKQIENLEARAKAKGAGPAEASALEIAKATAAMSTPLAVGQSFAGVIYPIILLVLLNNAGARAACLPRKPEGLDELGS